MKYLQICLFALLCGGILYAAQDTSLTQREVRDPLRLEAWLEANASDAQTRLTAVEPAAGQTLGYANKTANYTNTVTDTVVSYNTSAATTNTLPRAHTAYGRVFWVALQDDDGDLVVATTGTDTFDGTNNQITFADSGDSCALIATATNVYTILVNVGGTLGTQ